VTPFFTAAEVCQVEAELEALHCTVGLHLHDPCHAGVRDHYLIPWYGWCLRHLESATLIQFVQIEASTSGSVLVFYLYLHLCSVNSEVKQNQDKLDGIL
jgi:hypothetical protein